MRRVVKSGVFANGLHYGQWLYQFAHEYTHHLIGGTKSGEIHGQLWFEETLCETASRFAIHTLAHSGLCARLGLHRAFPVLRHYRDNHLAVSEHLYSEYLRKGSFATWLPLLQNPSSGYLREHYCVIADAFLPLFCTNPSLWSIIAHIGDSRQWRTLSELFAHLHSTECRTEAANLIKMHMMFLP